MTSKEPRYTRSDAKLSVKFATEIASKRTTRSVQTSVLIVSCISALAFNN